MNRIHNFSAGPAVLPESIVRQAQKDLYNHENTGLGIVECSHRSAQFDTVINSAKTRLHSLLGCDDDQEVLFLHGGARTQFYMLPMNLLRGGKAAYLDTGKWAEGAVEDAQRYGDIDVLFSSKETHWDRIPRQSDYAIEKGTRYLHYTSNNTVSGTEFHYRPEVPDGTWLMCDMSSNILSRRMDGSKFDFIYAGAQKNLGPSGTTVVIIRKSLLAQCDPNLPAMLRYGIHVAKDSMYNTPCTFSIYVIELMLRWITDQGGVDVVEARNRAQARKVYDLIDGSDFWTGKTAIDARSLMNLTFTTGNDRLDTTFWQTAANEGLSGLKGHRSVGGLRASLYNAQNDVSVDALCAFMRDFERQQG